MDDICGWRMWRKSIKVGGEECMMHEETNDRVQMIDGLSHAPDSMLWNNVKRNLAAPAIPYVSVQ